MQSKKDLHTFKKMSKRKRGIRNERKELLLSAKHEESV